MAVEIEGRSMRCASATLAENEAKLAHRLRDRDDALFLMRMAWLDGYQAGHQDATSYAVEQIGSGAVNRSRDHICRNCGEDRPGREGSAA